MKFLKTLLVNNKPYGLVKEHIWLDISTPGRADFTIKSKEPLTGIVSMAMGDSKQLNLIEIFTGFITKSTTVDQCQQRLFCRELSAVLWNTVPVSIKNASIQDILNIYSRETGLSFVFPQKHYTKKKCHTFQTVGNGIHGLDSLGAIFNIPNYIWQQQGDGQVFVGSWDDSRWAEKGLNLNQKFFQDVQLDGTKTLQALPGLRPGVKINNKFVTSLQLQGHEMVVKCEKQLSV